METRELKLVSRVKFPLPGFMLKKGYKRLIREVGEVVNNTAVEREIESGILKAKTFNKAFVLYPALCDIVSITWDAEHLQKIEEITGMKLTKLKDREILFNETKRLQDKYKELIHSEPKEGGVSFSQIVISTELILDMQIDRNIRLYEFGYYLKAASEKLKQLEKAK